MKKTLLILASVILLLSSCKLKEESDITGTGGEGISTQLKLLSPNGGETIVEGSSFDIKWSGKTTSLIKILYSFDNGLSWNLIADSLQNLGVYSWFPVPSTISTQCKIRIASVDGSTSDESDDVFSIIRSTNESLKITSPNGGEEWEAGSSKQIKWFSTGIDSVIIEYTTDNGNHWNYIATDKKNTGIYYWEPIPNTPSTLAKVRIKDAKDGKPSTESEKPFNILPEPKITVTIPNGKEIWLAGSSQKIEWISENVENVKIAYTTNNGYNWNTIIESYPSIGFYEWKEVPNVNSKLCKVRVYDAKDGEPWDVSDEPFEITNQISQSIKIISPNGGESWQAGTSQNITWSSVGITKVKIEYSSNNGLTWNEIINNLPNSGAYEWSVPNTLSTQCLVRISDAEDGDPVSQSEKVFKIIPKPEIKVLYPNGGESWTAGVLDTIRWQSIGVENVTIMFTANNGITWDKLVEKAPSNGKYAASFTSPSNQYKIRIFDYDRGSPIDESDGTFTVLPEPKITVLTPNGGEEWYAGSSDNIKWISTNIEYVKIEYTTNNGAVWNTIVDRTESDGVYSWNQIPNVSSLLCKIRISDADDGIPADVSDDVFTIINKGNQLIRVTSPNGGEKLTAGSSFNITWDAAGITNVKIEYTTNNGISWNTIVNSTPSTGFYNWAIVPSTASTNCKIRISDAQDGYPSDESDNFFSIEPEPRVKVLEPNGGESWNYGTPEEIRWESENIKNVKIEYTTDGGGSWTTIVNSISSIGSYIWNDIPNVNSNQCKIKISDAEDGVPYDLSDNNFQISNQVTQSIRIISPNGGERWQSGTSKNITWDSKGINNVDIDYTINNGLTWIPIAKSIPSSGSYEWNPIPTVNSTQCKVRVRDAADGEPSDESNATFTIQPSQSIEVIYPYSGVELLSGEKFKIQWRSTGIEYVKIEFNPYNSTDKSDWVVLVDSVSGTDEGNGIRSYEASFSVVSDNYVIRISDAVDGSPMDYTDGVFKVKPAPTINVIVPNGGEQWLATKANASTTDYQNYHPYEIKWNANNIQKVKIEWSTNGGGSWHTVPGAESTENDGIFIWAPGHKDLIRPDSSDNCKIRISSADPGVTAIDESDGYFSIHSSKKIRIEYPNGGQYFYLSADEMQNPKPSTHWPLLIKWTSYAISGNVNIYYSIQNGAEGTWKPIVTNYPSTGAYGWDFIFGTVKELLPSSLLRIKIVDSSDSKVWDINDNPINLNIIGN
ncbi:MAG: hypothetical protein WHS65_02850 [Melioribacteraceae bacterium]